jgi:hypothetical protein
VCVIFKEDDTPFDPESVRSKFIHVFIVVRAFPQRSGLPARYSMTVLRRKSMRMSGPALPAVELEHSPVLRSVLLSKAINAEYAAYETPKLLDLRMRQRVTMLRFLVKSLCARIIKGEGLLRVNIPKEVLRIADATDQSGAAEQSSSPTGPTSPGARRPPLEAGRHAGSLASLSAGQDSPQLRRLAQDSKAMAAAAASADNKSHGTQHARATRQASHGAPLRKEMRVLSEHRSLNRRYDAGTDDKDAGGDEQVEEYDGLDHVRRRRVSSVSEHDLYRTTSNRARVKSSKSSLGSSSGRRRGGEDVQAANAEDDRRENEPGGRSRRPASSGGRRSEPSAVISGGLEVPRGGSSHSVSPARGTSADASRAQGSRASRMLDEAFVSTDATDRIVDDSDRAHVRSRGGSERRKARGAASQSSGSSVEERSSQQSAGGSASESSMEGFSAIVSSSTQHGSVGTSVSGDHGPKGDVTVRPGDESKALRTHRHDGTPSGDGHSTTEKGGKSSGKSGESGAAAAGGAPVNRRKSGISALVNLVTRKDKSESMEELRSKNVRAERRVERAASMTGSRGRRRRSASDEEEDGNEEVSAGGGSHGGAQGSATTSSSFEFSPWLLGKLSRWIGRRKSAHESSSGTASAVGSPSMTAAAAAAPGAGGAHSFEALKEADGEHGQADDTGSGLKEAKSPPLASRTSHLGRLFRGSKRQSSGPSEDTNGKDGEGGNRSRPGSAANAGVVIVESGLSGVSREGSGEESPGHRPGAASSGRSEQGDGSLPESRDSGGSSPRHAWRRGGSARQRYNRDAGVAGANLLTVMVESGAQSTRPKRLNRASDAAMPAARENDEAKDAERTSGSSAQ